MRGFLGGILTGGLVSVLGLGVASVLSEQPAGVTPPDAPLVQAPVAETPAPDNTVADDVADVAEDIASNGPSTPVGSLTIDEPRAPALPEGEAAVVEPDAPSQQDPTEDAPRADTDPLDEPQVVSIEGAMAAPDAPSGVDVIGEPVAPVLPNPQSLAPQLPASEDDLTVSTEPAQPIVVIEPEAEAGEQVAATQNGAEMATETPGEGDDFFVVDLGADAAPQDDAMEADQGATDAAPADQEEDQDLSTQDIASAVVPDTGPRLQLGGTNTLLSDRDTGVTIRRPTDAAVDAGEGAATTTAANALEDYRASAGDVGSKPLMSIVLIDDGSMSAAAAALSGLPFAVTIALDPALPNAADLMERYRSDGFEVAVMAKLPEGAVPSDVEITFESLFSNLPESIAVLDIGDGGLQTDRAVTEQAMDILATQGRGFITASQGLNMAGRAAEAAGVPSAVVFRDLDSDNQDARVVRRFVDQAAFRARQESGVVLVGRVRPDTISALILWGTANNDEQVAIVPVSALLLAEE